jgi:hypothetical protein
VGITPRQDAILLALWDYHVLSTDLIVKLLFKSPGATSSAQTLLLSLYSMGYVQRKRLARDDGNTGKGFYIYGLATPGRNHLAEQGRDVDPRFRPSDFAALSRTAVFHTLATNAVVINLQLLTRSQPVQIAAWLHDHQMRRAPVRVATPAGATSGVVPDAWVDLRTNRGDGVYASSYLIELDRGTRERKSFQEKIGHLVALVQGPYEEHFGVPSAGATVAFVATEGEQHARRLCAWIEQELTRLQAAHVAPLFAVTPFAPAVDSPEALFLAPRTRKPFVPAPTALIDLEGGGG